MSNNDAVDHQEVMTQEEENGFMGRTSKEWLEFLKSLGSISLIVIGAMNLNKCDLLPTLPIFVIVFGVINIATGVIKIVWRTDRVVPPADDGEEAPPTHPMKHVASILGVSMIGVAIWGAVLTFPAVIDFWNDSEQNAQCSTAVFVAGFVSSVVVVVILSVVLIYAIVMCIFGKARSCNKADDAAAEESIV